VALELGCPLQIKDYGNLRIAVFAGDGRIEWCSISFGRICGVNGASRATENGAMTLFVFVLVVLCGALHNCVREFLLSD